MTRSARRSPLASSSRRRPATVLLVVALLAQAMLAGSAATALGAEPAPDPTPLPTEVLPEDPSPSVEPSVEPSTDVSFTSLSDMDPATVEVVEAVLPEPDPGLQPSAHYEDAMAHAEDRISFKPGGPVTHALTPGATGDIAAVSGGTKRLKQVFGFLPYWEVSDSANTLDYRVLSTIAYFSVGSDQNGNLLKKNADGTPTTGWGGFGSAALTNVINSAHANDTRVVLTITMFAWTSSQTERQAALLGNPAARQNLASQAALAVHNRGIDGINLDFEPIATGFADEFTALVRTFRAELDGLAPGYQLTFDTTGYIGNYPIEDATAPGGADAIFIMGYDYRTASVPSVGSISPLAGPAYDITDTVAAFAARVPASKLILGIPYYGRAWSTETDAVNAKNISGTQYGSSNTVIYKSAIEYAATHGRRWDGRELGPYVVYHRENCTAAYGCVNPWRQIYYDDAESLRLKYDLVNSMGLAGAGIWALGYDDSRTELNEVLAAKFLTTDLIAPVVTATTTPGTFSPNGDGIAERITLGWSVDEAVRGYARIRKGGTVYKTWAIGATGSITWNGIDRLGRMVPDGLYYLSIDVSDPSHNRTVQEFPIIVDRTAGHLAWSPAIFFPHDADGYAKSSKVSFRLARSAATTLRIYKQSGAYVKSAWVGRTQGAGTFSWTWDGRDGRGVRVPRGWYRAVLTATSWVGTTTLTRLILVDAFSVTAAPVSPAGGQTLTLTLRSAEPLRAAPRVTFRQAGLAAVTRAATSQGGGRYVVRFTVAAGAPGVATIAITARDAAGRTNAQSLTITVQ
ncbi:MAG: glycosyl hydrolase family 18 protein [Chloroflexota bacterium]